MACKKFQLRGEENRNRNDVAEAMESVVTDALMFATMCIVGMCVDVHTKDGSVFSGMFYTASVHKDFAIVLKNASMTKRGNRDGNVADGTLVETLIIRSEDLVQVVAKGVQLPSNGISGFVGGDRAEISLHYGEAETLKTKDSSWNEKHKSENRLYSKKENISPSNPTSKTENAKVDGRLAQNGSQRRQSDSKEAYKNFEVKYEGSTQEVHSPHISKDTTMQLPQDKPTSIGTPCSTIDTPNISVPSGNTADVNSESRFDVSPKPYTKPKVGAGFEKNVKESKLNPGAKIFSPSMSSKGMLTPIVPNGARISYLPGSYSMAPLVSAQEVDANSFSHSSVPVKFVPRNNIASANAGYGASYVQTMMGQMVNRNQHVRYAGQYHQIASTPAYSQPNPQTAMVGRAEPVFSMHPVAASAPGLSPLPPFVMQQTQPKHQGNAVGQLSVNPPIVATPPQTLVLANSVPISPQSFVRENIFY